MCVSERERKRGKEGERSMYIMFLSVLRNNYVVWDINAVHVLYKCTVCGLFACVCVGGGACACARVCGRAFCALACSSDLPIQKLLLESRETNSEVTLELLPSNVNTAAPPSLHRDISGPLTQNTQPIPLIGDLFNLSAVPVVINKWEWPTFRRVLAIQ